MVPNRSAALDINSLVAEYGNSLFRMCFLYLKDIHLAEDAVQDTFIKIYKSYSQFKGDSELKTWIMRIAINVCKNYQRNSWWKRVDASEALNRIPVDTNSEVMADDTLLLEIMQLSRKYKEVILLFYYQDMSIQEISQTLKIPQSTVSIRLKRARERLKVKLKGWYYDD
ncbi:MAG TPA: sigma-70 family RNA polymerase sigma factor [Syntrophomonadaceae bacterium]|nr:sigma-70 family RNA polymerase sigma factor [Syntrophomonadaceae bacterium]